MLVPFEPQFTRVNAVEARVDREAVPKSSAAVTSTSKLLELSAAKM